MKGKSSAHGENDMELKILYDNEAMEGFRSGFGFSCFVEEKKILFDTGGDMGTLLFNMRKFMINPREIDKIVLSHEHEDHTGGIRVLDCCGEVKFLFLDPFQADLRGD